MKQAVTSNLSGNEKIQYLKQTQWKNFPYPLPSENFEDLSPAQQNDVEIAYEQHVAANPPSTTTDGDSTNPAETNPNGTENETPEGGESAPAPTEDAVVEKPVEDVEKSVEQTEAQPEEGSVNA